MSNATYRYEISSTSRAMCQNKACKDAGIKIQKGELRFGTLVMFQEHSTWKWKHWGCVTPRQIANILDQLGGLDGLDLDKDLDILDGWDELTEEAQNKIKYALKHGHVADEDWRGSPELNRPGQKGINKRTPKKKADDEVAGDSGAERTPTKSKKSGKRQKPTADEDDEPAPKKKTSKKRKATAADEEDDEPAPKKKANKKRKATADDVDEAEEAPPKKGAKAKGAKAAIQDEGVDEEAVAKPRRRARGKKAEKVEEEEEEEAAELDTEKSAKKVKAKKNKRAAKEESDAEAEPVPKPMTKRSRAKKPKTEEDDDEDIAKDTNKRKPRRSRGNAADDDEAVAPIKGEEDGVGGDAASANQAETKVANQGKKRSRSSRGSRGSGT